MFSAQKKKQSLEASFQRAICELDTDSEIVCLKSIWMANPLKKQVSRREGAGARPGPAGMTSFDPLAHRSAQHLMGTSQLIQFCADHVLVLRSQNYDGIVSIAGTTTDIKSLFSDLF